jgi:hypothetical protein
VLMQPPQVMPATFRSAVCTFMPLFKEAIDNGPSIRPHPVLSLSTTSAGMTQFAPTYIVFAKLPTSSGLDIAVRVFPLRCED